MRNTRRDGSEIGGPGPEPGPRGSSWTVQAQMTGGPGLSSGTGAGTGAGRVLGGHPQPVRARCRASGPGPA